jgi:DNA-binding MarR family transcriptional regulator
VQAIAAADRTALREDLSALASHLLRSASLATVSAVAELDLSFTQIKALCALEAEPGASSVGSLAEALGISMPTMSRAVDGLCERGLVSREEHPADRRVKRVRLTASGSAVPAAIGAGRLSALQDLVDSLGEREAAQLAAALAGILAQRPEIAALRPDEGEQA